MQVGANGASVYQISQMLQASREQASRQIQETNLKIEQGKQAVQQNAAIASGGAGSQIDLYA